MVIRRAARAGTLESSDISVLVVPNEAGIEVFLQSSVETSFGDVIRAIVLETAQKLGVEHARIEATDHGALDCTIRARVETALERASKQEGVS